VKELRQRSLIFVELLRLVVVGVSAIVGYQLGDAQVGNHGPSGVLLGVLLGSATGYVLGGVFGRSTASAIASLERQVSRLGGGDILAGVLGTIFGVILAFVLSWPLLLVGLPMLTWAGGLVIVLVLGHLGYRIGRIKRDDLLAVLGMQSRLGPGHGGPGRVAKLLDTSVLTIARTGFLEGRLVVPSFVLAELQGLADAGDPQRRARGRRGLDVLRDLSHQPGLVLDIAERDYAETTDVDAKLLRLAREDDLSLITTDHNLARVAELSGVLVLNPNVLNDAVRPPMVPGELVAVLVQKPGREAEQGVGYLDDGTMVVVEGARGQVGRQVRAAVTSVLQNAQGRMVFAKLADPVHTEPGARAGNPA
jgi:uncharacterized protein YacL